MADPVTKLRRPFPVRLVLLVIGIVAMFVAAGTLLYFRPWVSSTTDQPANETAKVQQKKVCSDDTISKAASLIDSGDTYNLGLLVANNVTNLSEYSKDINCLYIVINYNLLNNVSSEKMDEDTQRYAALYEKASVRPSPVFTEQLSASQVTARNETIKTINQSDETSDDRNDGYGDSIVGNDGVKNVE